MGKKQQRRGVHGGKQGCPPQRDGKGQRRGAEQSLQVFLTWSHVPPLDTPEEPELPPRAHRAALRVVWELLS